MTLSVLAIVIPETSHDIVMGITGVSIGFIVAVSLAWIMFIISSFGFFVYFVYGGFASLAMVLFVM